MKSCFYQTSKPYGRLCLDSMPSNRDLSEKGLLRNLMVYQRLFHEDGYFGGHNHAYSTLGQAQNPRNPHSA